jgi:hypothetical protein
MSLGSGQSELRQGRRQLPLLDFFDGQGRAVPRQQLEELAGSTGPEQVEGLSWNQP